MLNNILTAVLLVFALASGCASTGTTTPTPRTVKNAAATVRLQDAQELEKRGKFLDAGLAYAQLANRANAPEKQDLQFKATEVFLRGSYTQQAEQTLADIDTRDLNASYVERKQLLLAQTELARGKRERAIAILDALARTATSDTTRVDVLKARPDLEIGRPTVRWVAAAMRAMARAAMDDFPVAIKIPVLMLAAGQDGVVATAATEQLGLRMRTGRHVIVPGARHELFMENDAIRAQVFAAFDAFITEPSA